MIHQMIVARRAILSAHVEMLLEAEARGGDADSVQLELIASEMESLRDLMRFAVLDEIAGRHAVALPS